MKDVQIKWGPIFCSCEDCVCQTLVAFREQGDSNWIIPAIDNPTQETKYTITIEEGVYYQVRLTFIGPLCQEKSTYFSIHYPGTPSGICCPPGYTLSPEKDYCFKIDEVSAIPPSGEAETLIAKQHAYYSTCGTYIYNMGYNIDGTGASSQITLTNPFWVNGPGTCNLNTPPVGPMNRCGVWATTQQDNQDVGFGVCITVPSTRIYYIGMGTDNLGIIKIDGNTIVHQDPVALGNQYSQGLFATFRVWHVYPVIITSGPHVVEIIGHNEEAVAAMGCEIYDATPTELIAATSYADLGPRLIFSSKDQIGLPVQLGTGDVGYTCPNGYSLSACGDTITCRKILNTSTISC